MPMSPEEWLASQQQAAPPPAAPAAAPLSPEEWLASQQQKAASDVPYFDESGEIIRSEVPEATIGEKAVGVGETALAVGTGATGGAIGYLAGALKGIAEELITGKFGEGIAEESAEAGAAALTRAPRTAKGQEYTQDVGEAAMQYVAPLAPMAAELTPIAQGAKAIPGAARTTATKVKQITAPGKSKPTPGTQPSAGSAGVDISTIRQEQAAELPVPIKLTKGQKTRTFEQQRFERETAKLPEAGEPLRERFANQNLQLQQNMDAFIDRSGAELTTTRAVGELVDKVLRDRSAKDKVKIRTLYKRAEKAGELADPVDINPVATWLNENRASRVEDGLMSKVQRKLDAMEVSEGNFANGDLKLKKMTINQAEDLRKFINEEVNHADVREVRVGKVLKDTIDDSTKGAGGEIYKKARAARAKYSRDYENVGLINKLLNTKKGSSDRSIALENVVDKVVLSPSTSVDEMVAVRRLLQTKTGGKTGPGAQAWREIQGSVLQQIQEQMTKNVATDIHGNKIVSASALDKMIKNLDKSGKLDYIFGKRGAEQLRTINEVAKDVLTAPPGAVNTSNTATVLAGLMDVAISGSAGVPVPVMTSFKLITKGLKDKKLKARVKRSLGE